MFRGIALVRRIAMVELSLNQSDLKVPENAVLQTLCDLGSSLKPQKKRWLHLWVKILFQMSGNVSQNSTCLQVTFRLANHEIHQMPDGGPFQREAGNKENK